ncbi:MAG: hypothetical protein K0R29_511 [Pseudobdellovibrio sp.]|nr:hypothetical protein [Pseudobdellovibrio sp.]
MQNNLTTVPTALNNLTAPDGVDRLDTLYGIGLEADGRWKWLKLGTRFKGILMSKDAPNSPTPPTAYLTVGQYSGAAIARLPFIERDSVNFDLLFELGAANTSIDVRTNGSGKSDIKCEACVFGRIGASINLGWPSFKFSFEGGQEFNNLTNLKATGDLAAANNISSIDLSGPYFAVGFIIYGIPSWIKPGGITVGK